MFQIVIGCFIFAVILSPVFIYFIVSKKKMYKSYKSENYMTIFNCLGKEMNKQNKFLENKLENIDFNVKKNNLVLEKLYTNKN